MYSIRSLYKQAVNVYKKDKWLSIEEGLEQSKKDHLTAPNHTQKDLVARLVVPRGHNSLIIRVVISGTMMHVLAHYRPDFHI